MLRRPGPPTGALPLDDTAGPTSPRPGPYHVNPSISKSWVRLCYVSS